MTETNQTPPASDSKPAVKTDAELIREVEMLKSRLAARDEQLKQAIEIATKANEVQAAKDAATKQDLIDRIVVDSNGKVAADELKDKSLNELTLLNTYLAKSLDQPFANIVALQAQKNKHTQPYLTVGAWDAASGSWKGGI